MVYWYHGTYNRTTHDRTSTNRRTHRETIAKGAQGFADYHDLTLGDLLEGIVLHAFDGKCPFSQDSLRRIRDLKKFYGLDLDANASHKLTEGKAAEDAAKRKAK